MKLIQVKKLINQSLLPLYSTVTVKSSVIFKTFVVLLLVSLTACDNSSPAAPSQGKTSPTETIPPTVLSVDPKIGSSDIPLDTTMRVSYSEALDAQTVSSASLLLMSGSLSDASLPRQPVNGKVVYVNDGENFIAALNPYGDLAPNKTYTLLATTAITDLAGNRGQFFTSSFTTVANSPDDTSAPIISATLPVAGGIDISVNRAIIATFSEAMEPSSVTDTSFLVEDDSTKSAVSGLVSYSGNNAIFTPLSPLTNNTVYNVTITSAVTDLASNPLPADYHWSFTTAAVDSSDLLAPGVSVVTPRNNSANVPLNSAISASFNEPLNPVSVNATSFSLSDGVGIVSAFVSYSGTTAVLMPSSSLATNTTYTATLTTMITDLAGNPLAANYSWSFNTAADITDTIPPTITAVTPINGAIDVARNSAISVDFSEGLNPSTVNAASFILSNASGSVPGTVIYNGQSAVFTPLLELQDSTLYTATLTASISDLAGNTLTSNYAWSFTTAASAAPSDTTPPEMVAGTQVPVNGATNVAINEAISIAFSEALNAGSVNTSTFLLQGTGGPVAGSVRYSGNTATYTPLVDLQNSSVYTVTVTTGIKDLAGNSMLVPVTWIFTTVDAATPRDTTAPSVVAGSLSPASGAIGVPVASVISAQFSEALDPSTVTSASVSLMLNGFPVSGSVLYGSSNTITFIPSANLAFDSLYTITINNSVTDLAGNALTANVSWSFTTVRPGNGVGMGGGNGGGMGGGG